MTADQLRLGLGRQSREVILVSRSDGHCIAALGETLEAVLANGFKHPETRLARDPVDLLHQALVDERKKRVRQFNLERAIRVADGARPLDRPAANENRQPPQQRLLGRIEQVIAPVDRAPKRALSLGDVARACS